MSDLERAKELARYVIAHYSSFATNEDYNLALLARALLRLLPVVEAAEAWSKRTGGCGSRGCACPQGDLWRAIDALRKGQP